MKPYFKVKKSLSDELTLIGTNRFRVSGAETNSPEPQETVHLAWSRSRWELLPGAGAAGNYYPEPEPERAQPITVNARSSSRRKSF